MSMDAGATFENCSTMRRARASVADEAADAPDAEGGRVPLVAGDAANGLDEEVGCFAVALTTHGSAEDGEAVGEDAPPGGREGEASAVARIEGELGEEMQRDAEGLARRLGFDSEGIGEVEGVYDELEHTGL